MLTKVAATDWPICYRHAHVHSTILSIGPTVLQAKEICAWPFSSVRFWRSGSELGIRWWSLIVFLIPFVHLVLDAGIECHFPRSAVFRKVCFCFCKCIFGNPQSFLNCTELFALLGVFSVKVVEFTKSSVKFFIGPRQPKFLIIVSSRSSHRWVYNGPDPGS